MFFFKQRTLEREVRGCQVLIIWTDCDREGENIGFEAIEVCQSSKWSFFFVYFILSFSVLLVCQNFANRDLPFTHDHCVVKHTPSFQSG